MRFIQDIGDLLLAGFLFSPYGWIALLLGGIFFMAVREEMTTEEGKRRWQGCAQLVRGRKRIALVSIVAIIALVLSFQFMTSGSHGRCSKDGKYPTDEEFIKAALAMLLYKFDPSNVEQGSELAKKLAADYWAKNPDCCKVFRERADEDEGVRALSWVIWRNGVVVQIRRDESLKAFRRGEKRLFDVGLNYVYVGNCGGGGYGDAMLEITPGG
ncbi:MAG: hypothetical protein PHQ60_06300 [Sideroxydans sp.]|nr:hypothetical protein [Sideroxydans sp.]